MATTSVQGSSIGIYFRDFGTSQAWKLLVCADASSFSANNDVNTKKTKCGVFKGVLAPDMKITGSGMCNTTPTSSEYSYDALQNDQQNIQKKEFRIQDNATLGTVIMINGGGYFSASELTFNNGETMDFTFTFDVDGTVITSES